MASEPRRVWGGVLVPADLHAELTPLVGPRGLNNAVEDGLRRLLAGECGCEAPRPTRDSGTVTITVRVPVSLADAVEGWRAERMLSRQALVEYALLAVLQGQRAPAGAERVAAAHR